MAYIPSNDNARDQIMPVGTLREWLAATECPECVDLAKTAVPNVFSARFDGELSPAQIRQLSAFSIEVENTDANDYLLRWQPPEDDEV